MLRASFCNANSHECLHHSLLYPAVCLFIFSFAREISHLENFSLRRVKSAEFPAFCILIWLLNPSLERRLSKINSREFCMHKQIRKFSQGARPPKWAERIKSKSKIIQRCAHEVKFAEIRFTLTQTENKSNSSYFKSEIKASVIMSLCARAGVTSAPKVTQWVGATLPWKWELVSDWYCRPGGCWCHREPIKWRRKEAAFHLCCWSARLSASLIDPSRALSCCAANVARRFLSLLGRISSRLKELGVWRERGDALAFCRARWNSANLHRRKS